MNAFVIDQKQLKRYVIEIIVALVIAFSLGFALGLQQAKVNTEIEQAEQKKITENKLNEKTIEGSAAKEKAVVEKARLAAEKREQEKIAEEKRALKKLAEKKLAQQKLEKEKLAKQKLAKEKLAKEKLATQKAAKEKLAKEKAAKLKAEKERQAKKKLEKQQQEAKAASQSSPIPPPVNNQNNTQGQSTQSGKQVFSIQAGMFASKSNAQSFIEKLAAKNFDAYVSDFESTSGTTKYNVRVGKFGNREKAREQLKEFQKSFSTPAYVVITQ